MKRRLVIGIVSILCALTSVVGWSQVTADPLVAAAVASASALEKESLDNINNEQTRITTSQAWINRELSQIKTIQEKTYSYLSTISATVSSAHDIKKAADRTVEIAKLCEELGRAVKENPQGFLTTAVGTKQISSVKKEMVELYSYIANLSLNKELLMNAYERLVITGQVAHRLQTICFKLRTLTYCVYSLSFKDLPRLLAPDIYYSVIDQEQIARSIINSWK